MSAIKTELSSVVFLSLRGSTEKSFAEEARITVDARNPSALKLINNHLIQEERKELLKPTSRFLIKAREPRKGNLNIIENFRKIYSKK